LTDRGLRGLHPRRPPRTGRRGVLRHRHHLHRALLGTAELGPGTGPPSEYPVPHRVPSALLDGPHAQGPPTGARSRPRRGSPAPAGDLWALRNWTPVPDLVASAPASNDFRPGFSTDLMLKDLRLACEAADSVGAPLDTARTVRALFTDHAERGAGQRDCSSLI